MNHSNICHICRLRMAGELEKASKWDKRYPTGTTAGILKRIN
jgi:hypothetical protein